METVYYNLNARRVSVSDMASGETSPQCRSYALLRRADEKRPGKSGRVLDMEAYRRRFDAQDAEGEEASAGPVPRPVKAPANRSRRGGVVLELFATLAILVMSTVVILVFLPFL